MNKIKSYILPIIFLFLILIIWKLIIIIFNIPNYLLPTPIEIFTALIKNKNEFLRAALVTFQITLISTIISSILGSIIAVTLFFNKFIEKLVSPYLIILQIIPIISVIPLLIIWFKSNTLLTLIICSVICSIFPIISSMNSGLAQTEKSLIMIFQIYKATIFQKIFKLYLPSAMPFFLNGLHITSALALIGCISAEFIAGTGGRSSGIAYQLLMAGYNLQTDKLFAALFVITLLGLLIHFIFKLIKNLFVN
jgi:NitT/TauT family transport system permease protein